MNRLFEYEIIKPFNFWVKEPNRETNPINELKDLIYDGLLRDRLIRYNPKTQQVLYMLLNTYKKDKLLEQGHKLLNYEGDS